ncbi:MAG TPA: alanine racemase [Abditibacteriaceae bacterium]|nr:alanine racemase [Abditibacteriaceae bacterium]
MPTPHSTGDPQPPHFSRPAWAGIDLEALQSNVRELSRVLEPSTGILAVIKANAYGHGAVPIARALLDQTSTSPSSRVQMLCVASVDEGLQLRAAGIAAPILLLSAILPDEAYSAVAARLTPTVFTRELAAALDAAGGVLGCVAEAHLKIDTGMGRLGIWHCEAPAFYASLQEYSRLRVTGIYTHFACADEPVDAMTTVQSAAFQSALRECCITESSASGRSVIHACNSAALLRYPQAHGDCVRPGLALYGVLPTATSGTGLRPVMTLKARLTSVKTVAVGATISYGATWRAQRPSCIATVPVGYADGYPRSLSNRAQVLVRGTLCPLVGRVTMDQILIDCTNLVPNVEVGESVTLFGSDLPVADVAAWAGTIPYEILCGIAPRVPRVYV